MANEADTKATWLDENRLESLMRSCSGNLDEAELAPRVRDILAKAAELGGLNLEEVAVLMDIRSPELTAELFNTAKKVKE